MRKFIGRVSTQSSSFFLFHERCGGTGQSACLLVRRVDNQLQASELCVYSIIIILRRELVDACNQKQ